ncbi:hypothetical protein [Halalkalibacterium halodurans]|uniref:hypothetical protein n=1 Tax=Halalkalibacterium halodurans TaxID=86665 RepID=UPI00187560FA|nr:hypothetical protein [Halalkalibacterium halodurans]
MSGEVTRKNIAVSVRREFDWSRQVNGIRSTENVRDGKGAQGESPQELRIREEIS